MCKNNAPQDIHTNCFMIIDNTILSEYSDFLAFHFIIGNAVAK